MKRIIKCLLLVILLSLSINVKADSNCDKKELSRLKELAKKVEFDYDYKLVGEKAVFSITAVNLNSDLQVVILDGDEYSGKYKEFANNSEHKATLTNFYSGEKVKITIRAFVPNFCSYEKLTTKTISLPYYNYFYDEEKCQGNEEFKYCKLLIDSNITQTEFDRQFEIYLKNKNKQEDNPVVKEEDNFGLYITIVALVLAVIVVTLIIINVVKRRKKNKL